MKSYCAVVYYLSSGHGLLRSDDGGATWSRLTAAPDPGVHKNGDWSEGLQTAPRLAVDQRRGAVYLGGANGLFRSADQGQTWERLHSDAVYSLALAPSGKVFISGPGHVLVSEDSGRSFTALPGIGLDAGSSHRIQGLTVSPADPRRMLCWTSGAGFTWPRYVTMDGGKTWERIQVEKGGGSFAAEYARGLCYLEPQKP